MQASALVGSYALRGVRDAVASLELSSDGRFQFGESFGAVDRHAEGAWNLTGDRIQLTAEPAPPAAFSLRKANELPLDEHAGQTEQKVLMGVLVRTPRLEMTWANIEVSAEFSNGQVRSGKTGRDGMLGFVQLPQPEWQDATVRRVGFAYPRAKVTQIWFAVPSAATKSLVIDFEPGPELDRPAFETVTLRVRGPANRRELVTEVQGRAEGRVFARR